MRISDLSSDVSSDLQAAHVLAKLAADEVQGLDAVGALVDLRDARVAHELLHAVLADVAVAAVDLHAEIGDLEAGIGEEGFYDRRHQRDEVVRLLALRGVRVLLDRKSTRLNSSH